MHINERLSDGRRVVYAMQGEEPQQNCRQIQTQGEAEERRATGWFVPHPYLMPHTSNLKPHTSHLIPRSHTSYP